VALGAETEQTEKEEMSDMAARRRFFAEELEAVCKLRSPALVDAFAAVPRERYLRPGPWTVLAESDSITGLRTRATPDADPARVCHNIAVAIDPQRMLFNGQPATLGVWLDALDLVPGARVLHVGCGLGYYTAVMAHCVGPTGRVVALEVDEALAGEARVNLASLAWVEARHADGSGPLRETFDAILVNAGVTHPLEVWLDSVAVGGRMVLPLTGTMPAMGATIGKGLVLLLTRLEAGDFAVRVLSFVAIYSALGLRDAGMNERLGKAMTGGSIGWQALKRLRRDPHEQAAGCWLHGPHFCLSEG
jgi:protein-L-isoaspartate(D-aspartate) O-methyltransferase